MVAASREEPMAKVANRVLAKVAVKDATGKTHPRGLVVELSPGKVVFYRDVTQAVLVSNGYAIERGVLCWLGLQDVQRVHYRVKGGPLMATSVTDYLSQGWALEANGRDQLALPLNRWTQYAADLAYDVPVAELPWTIVDHATGLATTEDAALEDEVAAAVAAFDERQALADAAMSRLRKAVIDLPDRVDPVTLDLAYVLDYLMRTDVEARV